MVSWLIKEKKSQSLRPRKKQKKIWSKLLEKKIKTKKKKLGQKSLRLRSVLKNLEKIINLNQQKKQEE